MEATHVKKRASPSRWSEDMYKTISSRLTAQFNVDGGHLQRYLDNKQIITKSFCEDLILHDQILIPTQDYLTACGLILIIGEKGFIELLEREKLKFVRTRWGFGFISGKGPAEIGIFGDPDKMRPMDSPIDQSVSAGLNVIEGNLKDKKKLHECIVQNSYSIEWSAILDAIKQESIRDLKYTKTWNSRYESNNPNYILLPKSQKVNVRVIGPKFDPQRNISDTLLALTQYNSDLFLANKFSCQDISPFYPMGDLLEIKNNRIINEIGHTENLWTLFEVNGVPDLSQFVLTQESNMSDLLKVATNKNATDFREWFHRNQELNEKEILREYLSVLKQVPTIQRFPLKSLRFIITTVTGFVPVLGQIAGVFDSFIIERIFKGRSPKFFIDDLTKATGSLKLQQKAAADGYRRR